jgi:hypothetical protein
VSAELHSVKIIAADTENREVIIDGVNVTSRISAISFSLTCDDLVNEATVYLTPNSLEIDALVNIVPFFDGVDGALLGEIVMLLKAKALESNMSINDYLFRWLNQMRLRPAIANGEQFG